MFDKVEAFYRPGNVREALRLLQSGKGQARVVAGGTDVVVEGDDSVRFLIDITHAGLSYIRRRGAACVIGATTTMAEMEDSEVIQALAGGLLSRAARTCGSVPIRNLATLGGNMANGSPAADMATPLLVLDAAVVMLDARGRRKMPLTEYLVAARSNRDAMSLLVEIVIPDPPDGKGCKWSFQKLGRTAVDISLVNVAAGLQLTSAGRVKWARIALGSVAPAPMRAAGAEQRMTGRMLDQTLLAEIGAEVAREVNPISDARASAEYRREICSVLTRRALEECSLRAGCSL
jgi:aerobic carbon-monoxide dehydrogenase medium subunit